MKPFVAGPEWIGWLLHDNYPGCRYREARDAKETSITVYIFHDGAVDIDQDIVCDFAGDHLATFALKYPDPETARRAIEALVEQGGLRWEE